MTPLFLILLSGSFFISGVWAVATNRRWVFLTAFSINTSIGVIVFSGKSLSGESFSIFLWLLVWGLCFEICLFHIRTVRTFFSRVFWSITAGLVLWVVLEGGLAIILGNMSDVMISEIFSYTTCVNIIFFAGYLLIITYIGIGVAKILKRFLPDIFEI